MTNRTSNNIFKNLIPFLFWTFAVLYFAYESFQKPVHSEDGFVQTQVAYNMAKGNGFSISYIDLNDISETKFKKYFNFAPGYTLILAALINFFEDPANIHHWMVFILLITNLFTIYKLMIYLKPEAKAWLVYLVLLFTVVSNTLQGSFTDLASLNAFLVSLFVFSNILKDSKKFRFDLVLLLSILCFLCGFFRYAYYPVCFVYFGSFILLYLIQKDFRFIKYGLTNFLLVTLFLLPQIIVKIYFTEQISIVNETEEELAQKGLKISQLLYIKPVFFSAFLDEVILYRILGYEGTGGYDRGYMIPMFMRIGILSISTFFMFLFTYFGISTIISYYKKRDTKRYPIILGLGTGTFIKIAFFTAIAVYYQSYGDGFVWTLASVGRYYNVVFVTILVLVFIYLSNLKKPLSLINKIVVFFLAGALLINAAHKIYLSTKYSFTDKEKNINIAYPPANLISDSKDLMKKLKVDTIKYAAFLYEEKKLNPAEKIMIHYIALSGIPSKKINVNSIINSKNDVFILSTLNESELNNKTSLRIEKYGEYHTLSNAQYRIHVYKLSIN